MARRERRRRSPGWDRRRVWRLAGLVLALAFAAHVWASRPARLPDAARAERTERLALARALDEALDERVSAELPLGGGWDVLTASAADPPPDGPGWGVPTRVLRQFRPPGARALRLTLAPRARAPVPVTEAARRWLDRPAAELVALLETPPRWGSAARAAPRLRALAAIPVGPASDHARPTIAQALRGHGFTHLVVTEAGHPPVVLLLSLPTVRVP